jgi:hypothetical protein
MSQEEKDKEIKERLKRERREQRKVASSMQLSVSHLKNETAISEEMISNGYQIFEKETKNEEIHPNKHRSHHNKTQKQEICDEHSDRGICDTAAEKSKSRLEMNTHNTFRLVKSIEASTDVDDDLSRRIVEKMREKQRSRKKSRRHKQTSLDKMCLNSFGGRNEVLDRKSRGFGVNISDCKQDTSENNMQPQDRRKSIAAWTHKYDLRRAVILAEKTPEMDWLSSFYRCDPRWQILKFFNEVAREVR